MVRLQHTIELTIDVYPYHHLCDRRLWHSPEQVTTAQRCSEISNSNISRASYQDTTTIEGGGLLSNLISHAFEDLVDGGMHVVLDVSIARNHIVGQPFSPSAALERPTDLLPSQLLRIR